MKLERNTHPVGTRFIMLLNKTIWEATVIEWSSKGHVKIRYDYGQYSWFTADALPEIEESFPPIVLVPFPQNWKGWINFFFKSR